MANIQEFSKQLIEAIEVKTQWFDNDQLPIVLEQYRLLHTCVSNIYKLLLQKSKLNGDPYKHEKKISEVEPPENSQFTDNETSVILGTRFSDYESMLDFICTYFNFSVSYMNLKRIKNLIDLNNSFAWHNLSLNSTSPNTRGLAKLIYQLRQESDQMVLSSLNDGINKISAAFERINTILKSLADFQKEVYKSLIRKNIFEHPSFDSKLAFSSRSNELIQIKKIYPSVLSAMPFYTTLIEEIISEDQGNKKDELQEALLKKLHVDCSNSERKKAKIDSKELLMEAVSALTAASPSISSILEKIKENHEEIESIHNSGFQKFVKLLRKAFKIAEPEVIYQILVTDPSTKTGKKENIQYYVFEKKLIQLSRFLLALSSKNSAVYKKVENSEPDKIIEFINKNISECQKFLIQLTALDDFFKNCVPSTSANKIKGLKVDLMAFKNAIIKTNQRRIEYSSYVEEELQMKKLGIINED